MLTIAPMPVAGGTGFPVNAIAMFSQAVVKVETACEAQGMATEAESHRESPSGSISGHMFAALCVVTMLSAACRSTPAPQPPPTAVVVWKPIGSWSGRGDKQTETFTSDTGGFRVHWETTNESPAGGGRLRVVFRSGDSGREIIEAIDARGAGSGIEEVAAERPRWYYITVESANVDWKIAVDERIGAQTKP